MRKDAIVPALLLTALCLPVKTTLSQTPAASGQAAAAAPRQSGTVKAVTPRDFVLTNATGQDFAVNIPGSVRVLLVDPGTRDVKNARPGTLSDLAAGDKAIVIGTPGDTGQSMTATRVLLLKSGAIAALHAEQQAEWAHSLGGLVRSVDQATNTISVVNGARMLTVRTTSSTVVRRYAPGSVRFEDAVKSSVAAIQPGDQVQARGQHAADGTSLTADEIVSGSFANMSGVLTAVDPAAGTVTLTDLATKHPVTVAIAAKSNLRKLPDGFARGTAAEHSGAGSAGTPTPAHTQSPTHGTETRPATEGGRASAGRIDLARILGRLPTETLAELKPGDAVMIVASKEAGGGNPVAITLVSGVGQILASSSAGETTLSPWSLGSSGEGGGEGSDAGSGGQ